MRLIRKYDVFKELTKYADGDLSLGDCIDNCETLDISKVIIRIQRIASDLKAIADTEQNLGFAGVILNDQIEGLKTLANKLKEWENEDG